MQVAVDTAQVSERASAGAALAFFMGRYPEAMQPHAEALLQAALPLICYAFSPDIRKSCSSILASAVVCVRGTSDLDAEFLTWVNQVTVPLLRAIQTEPITSAQTSHVEALQRIVTAVPEDTVGIAGHEEVLVECAGTLKNVLEGALAAWRRLWEEEEEGEEEEGAQQSEDGPAAANTQRSSEASEELMQVVCLCWCSAGLALTVAGPCPCLSGREATVGSHHKRKTVTGRCKRLALAKRLMGTWGRLGAVVAGWTTTLGGRWGAHLSFQVHAWAGPGGALVEVAGCATSTLTSVIQAQYFDGLWPLIAWCAAAGH